MTLLPNFTVTKNTFFLQVVKIVPVNFIIDADFTMKPSSLRIGIKVQL
nr:MAG TPA: hypothetical protein [Caudoviricetes sp.]